MTRSSSSWLYRQFSFANRGRTKRPANSPWHRPRLESLEDRTLLTTWADLANAFNPGREALLGRVGDLARQALGSGLLAQLPLIRDSLGDAFQAATRLTQVLPQNPLPTNLTCESARPFLIGLGLEVQYLNANCDAEAVTGDLVRLRYYTRTQTPQPSNPVNVSSRTQFAYFDNEDNNGSITHVGSPALSAAAIQLEVVFGVDLDSGVPRFFVREATAAAPTLALTGVGGAMQIRANTANARLNIGNLLNVQLESNPQAVFNLGGRLVLEDAVPGAPTKLRREQFVSGGLPVTGAITGSVALTAGLSTTLANLPTIRWNANLTANVDTARTPAITFSGGVAPSTNPLDLLRGLADSFFRIAAGFNPLGGLEGGQNLNKKLPLIDKSPFEALGIGNIQSLNWLLRDNRPQPGGGDLLNIGTINAFLAGISPNLRLGSAAMPIDCVTGCANSIETRLGQIIRGERVDLISFDTDVQRTSWGVGFNFGLYVPILPPVLAFSVGAEFRADLFFQYRVGLGLDTTGFYIHPGTHIAVGGGVSASLYGGLSVFGFNIAKVQGGLGVAATAKLGLCDPDPSDGKIYLDEIFRPGEGLASSFLRSLKPSISIDVTAYLKAVIDLWIVKFTVFQKDWRFPVANWERPCPGPGTERPLALNTLRAALQPTRVEQIGNVLHVRGTAGDDNVILEREGGLVKVNWVGLGRKSDIPAASVSRVVFTGGSGHDRLQVRPGFNIPVEADGGAGDDYLEGGDAGDTLRGGESGRDTLVGGAGNDTLYGGGNDWIDGGVEKGGDLLQGLGGNDALFGDGGNDTLDGGEGIDDLTGGAGNDFLDGGTGIERDNLFGNDGNDILLGRLGGDLLDGGANDDLLVGGFGNDTLQGGTGADTLVGDNNNEDDLQGGDDSLVGGADNDVLVGEAGSDLLYGDDTVAGPSGNDSLFGGRGDDILRGGVGNDVLEGGDGADQLHGENGDDVLRGDAGGDELRGGFGNDTLNGGAGADRLFGDDDEDRLELDFATNDGAIVDELRGGLGTDRIVVVGRNDRIPDRPDVPPILRNVSEDDVIGFSQAPIPGGFRYTATSYHPGSGVVLGTVKFILPADTDNNDIEQLAIDGMKGNDRILVDPDVGRNLILIGGEGNDVLRGGKGRDVLYGGAGTDDLIGGQGDDELHGGLGGCAYTPQRNYCDQLDGGQGSDALYGGDGHDRLTGGDDSDAVRGGADVLHGGLGNDYMEAGPGRFGDLMYGEAGDDTLIGGDGRDVLSGDGHDTTQAAAGNDLLRGGGFYDVLLGGGGNDTLYGQGGADVVLGEGGNDLLYAEDVSGYLDQTPLNIGEVLTRLAQRLLDRAREFAGIELRRNDVQLALNQATEPDDRVRLQLLVNDMNNQLTILAREIIQITDSIRDLLRPYDGTTVDLVDGGSGNDTLYGSQYNDFLYGNDGDDSLFHSNGNDTVSGGPGTQDTYVFEGTPGNDTLEMRARPAPDNNYFVDFYVDGVLRATLLRRPDIEGLRVNAQGGHDTVKLGAGFGGVAVFPNVILDGGEGNDTLTGITSGNYTVLGGAGDDVYRLEGTTGNDRIELRTEQSLFSVFVGGTLQGRLRQLEAERILVLGLDGNDTLSGAGLTGPAGGCALELRGGPDDDRLTGGPCNDTLYGGLGNDTLDGQGGVDQLFGEEGDDVLDGGPMGTVDWLSGGPDNDRMYFPDYGQPRIIPLFDGGSGADDRLVVRAYQGQTVAAFARGWWDGPNSIWWTYPAGSNFEAYDLETNGSGSVIRYGTTQEARGEEFGFYPGRLYKDGRPLVTITEFALQPAVDYPAGITRGPDGNVWFTDIVRGIWRMTPAGVTTLFPLAGAWLITSAPDGNLWFTNQGRNSIGRITTQGAITEFPIPTPNSLPESITADRDGNLWFTEYNGNKIGRVTPAGEFAEYTIPTAGSRPYGITLEPEGNNLWFTENAVSKIGRITPEGEIQEFSRPDLNGPYRITAGPDGKLWFTEAGGRGLRNVTTSGVISDRFQAGLSANSLPWGITAGPDGNLWFTDRNSTRPRVGRITPAGEITEYLTPTNTAGTRPWDITVGPDGNLWTTYHGESKIARVTPGSPDWFQVTPYAVGALPLGATAADFNGDNKPDLAVAYNGVPDTNGGVTVLVQNADGTFTTRADYRTGSSAIAVATGDFNRDGRQDLAVANSGSNTVSILLGNGNGTFRPPTNLNTAVYPNGLVVRDFNNDTHLDLALASRSGGVEVWLGNGLGVFSRLGFYAGGTQSFGLALGDFNGDGRPDLVTNSYTTNNVTVFLGNPDGSFQFVRNVATVGAVGFVPAVGDFNRDGKDDIAAPNSTGAMLSVLLGNGNGTFQPAVGYGPAGYTVTVAALDVDRDNRLDLVANNFDDNSISLFRGNGDGTFGVRIRQVVGTRPDRFTVADFNSDGAPDLAVPLGGANQVAILRNVPLPPLTQAAVAFRVTPNIPLSGVGTVTVAAQDAFGNVVPSFRGTVRFSSSDAGATLPANYPFLAADNGMKTFNVTLPTAGRHTLSVVDMANTSLKGIGPEITEFQVPTPASTPYKIVTGPDGNLWFTERFGNKIGRLNPATGQVTEWVVPTPASQPFGITVGPDGNLWFTEYAGKKIGRITPAGVITEFLPPTNAFLGFITAGPDGNLWFAEYTVNKIGRITPAGVITEFAGLAGEANDITAGPDGNLWFTEFNGNRIGRITPAGYVTEFPLPTPNAGPHDIVAGPDGKLWFTELTGNKIGRFDFRTDRFVEYTLPVGSSRPYGLGVGPDGNLWFTENNSGGHIGRITPAGVITRFVLSTPNSGPTGITTGPDGNLWFTEYLGNKIGRLAPGILVAAPPVSLGVTANFATLAAGSALTVTVTARDSAGRTNPGYRGTVRFTSNDAQVPQPLPDYTFTAADNGVKTFAITLKTAGSRTVTATDTVTGTITGNVGVTVQSAILGTATAAGAVGQYPRGVASGDFDRDGIVDLVTANEGSNTVSVLLGNGNGTFRAAGTFSTGLATDSAPQALAVGDFNRDGSLDVIVANRGRSQLVLLLGNGNGTLQAARLIAGQDLVSQVIAADFTNDGKLDLVAPYTPDRHGGFYLGNGDGTFRLIQIPLLGDGPVFVAAGHFNADSFLDLMAVNGRGNNVSVLLGNGNGTFQAPVFYPVGAAPTSATVAEVNGDNRRDLIVTNGNGNSVSVLLGTGTGTFQAATTFPAGTYPTAVAATDLNGDSVPDLAVTHADGRLAMLLGIGTGAFGTPSFQQLDSPTYGLAVADFTGDLRPDVVVPRYVRNDVVMLRNVSLAALTAVPSTVTPMAGVAFTVTVTARDAYGNAATGYRGNVCLTSTDPRRPNLGCQTFVAADNGVKVFSNLTLETAGSRTITVRDAANNFTVALPVTVSPAAATLLTVSGFPTPITAGVARTITVTALDPFGNIATGFRDRIRLDSTDGQAQFPLREYVFTAADNGTKALTVELRTAGTWVITATDLTNPAIPPGSQSGIVVNPAQHSGFRVTAPATITAGQAFDATVRAVDAFGNTASGYGGTVRFSSPEDPFAVLPADRSFAGSGGQITVTGIQLRTPGARTFRVADGGLFGTAPVIVTPLALTVDGTEAADTLVLREQSGNAAFFQILLNDVVTASGPWVMLASVTLNGLGENDTITVAQTRPGLPVQVSGGDGVDTLQGPDAVNTWRITYYDMGTVDTVTFLEVENLRGGALADTFLFEDGMGITGQLDGGGGIDTLDFASYSTAVYADLYYGYAAGSTFFYVLGIENVTGGSGDDTLRGDGAANVLIGNGGNDVLIGLEGDDTLQGNDGRDLLIGGVGADRLEGGTGEDILLDGYTMYDYDDAALALIMQEWTAPGIDYAVRVETLRTHATAPLIPDTTVFTDGEEDQLLGEGDLDWFWTYDGVDLLPDWIEEELFN